MSSLLTLAGFIDAQQQQIPSSQPEQSGTPAIPTLFDNNGTVNAVSAAQAASLVVNHPAGMDKEGPDGQGLKNTENTLINLIAEDANYALSLYGNGANGIQEAAFGYVLGVGAIIERFGVDAIRWSFPLVEGETLVDGGDSATEPSFTLKYALGGSATAGDDFELFLTPHEAAGSEHVVIDDTDAQALNFGASNGAFAERCWPLFIGDVAYPSPTGSSTANAAVHSTDTDNVVAVIRIDDEIIGLSATLADWTEPQTNRIKIAHCKRGMWGSTISTHSVESRIFAPVYTGSPGAVSFDTGLQGTPARRNSGQPLRYSVDTETTAGRKAIAYMFEWGLLGVRTAVPKTVTGMDTGNDEVDFGAAHGMTTGQVACFAYPPDELFDVDRAGYYVRAVTSTSLAFYTTAANASADTSRVNITTSSVPTGFTIIPCRGTYEAPVCNKFHMDVVTDRYNKSFAWSLLDLHFGGSNSPGLWNFTIGGRPDLTGTSAGASIVTAVAKCEAIHALLEARFTGYVYYSINNFRAQSNGAAGAGFATTGERQVQTNYVTSNASSPDFRGMDLEFFCQSGNVENIELVQAFQCAQDNDAVTPWPKPYQNDSGLATAQLIRLATGVVLICWHDTWTNFGGMKNRSSTSDPAALFSDRDGNEFLNTPLGSPTIETPASLASLKIGGIYIREWDGGWVLLNLSGSPIDWTSPSGTHWNAMTQTGTGGSTTYTEITGGDDVSVPASDCVLVLKSV